MCVCVCVCVEWEGGRKQQAEKPVILLGFSFHISLDSLTTGIIEVKVWHLIQGRSPGDGNEKSLLVSHTVITDNASHVIQVYEGCISQTQKGVLFLLEF